MPKKKLIAKVMKTDKATFIMPQTGMNNSGDIVGILKQFNCTHQNLAEENGVTFCQVCNQTI